MHQDVVPYASAQFSRGYSCSQAVLSDFAEEFSLSEDLALKAAGVFGGGVAGSGKMCGAGGFSYSFTTTIGKVGWKMKPL